ncbi:hypothetical protein [Nocardioides sp. YIM 152315]|uniref:hypothetical protein n=1 Tax=Nocardioides sp. YIM 152315 TaxID=3031760 RepID=UPI0023DCC550|nr:hypothetical protein [Nocardioides sp. YIM 152315]MDF1605262.1 hypothetical protein [Nocardioides sp. YIM 152315]
MRATDSGRQEGGAMYGDTEVMHRRALELREQGVDLRALADRLVASTEGVGWTGRAAAALDERIRVRAAHLREVAGRHDDAAEALDAHLVEVDRLKETIADIERRAGLLADANTATPPSGHRDWLTLDLPGL